MYGDKFVHRLNKVTKYRFDLWIKRPKFVEGSGEDSSWCLSSDNVCRTCWFLRQTNENYVAKFFFSFILL